MPLINCPDCGRSHSDAAATCPECGRPNASPAARAVHGRSEGCFLRTMNIGCALVIGFILLTALIVALTARYDETHPPEMQADTVVVP